MKFIARWIVTALAVAVAAWLVPGITLIGGDGNLESLAALAIAALALAFVNMFIKPIVQVLSCPLIILTLGLFYLVLNALMLEFAAWLASAVFGMGIAIDGFGSAFLGSIIISIVSLIANGLAKGSQAGSARHPQ